MKIAVLSDIHGNLSALQAVMDDAFYLGCERIISLGDVAGYYCEPGPCIDLLRKNNAINIMGNHDFYLTSNTSCPRSKRVADIIEYQRSIVSIEQKKWLSQSLPFLIEDDCYFTHGGWDNYQDQYLYTLCVDDIPQAATLLFSGHTHVQVLADFGAQRYCNPGSVGQPRDGNPQAAYAILDGRNIQLRRVAYDIDITARAMAAAGFTPEFYENLYIGAQIGGRIDNVKIITAGKH